MDGGGGVKRRAGEKKYRAGAIRHVRKALENAFNLSVNIQRAGLYTPSLKRGRFPVYLS